MSLITLSIGDFLSVPSDLSFGAIKRDTSVSVLVLSLGLPGSHGFLVDHDGNQFP